MIDKHNQSYFFFINPIKTTAIRRATSLLPLCVPYTHIYHSYQGPRIPLYECRGWKIVPTLPAYDGGKSVDDVGVGVGGWQRVLVDGQG